MKRFVGVFILVAVGLSAGYSALIYYDNNFRYGRMRETPAVRPHENPIPTMDKDVIPTDGGEAVFRVTGGKGLTSPLEHDAPETLAAGKKAYFTYCVHCHGKNLDGLGTVGQSFNPLPKNLRSHQVLDQADGSLFYTTSYGKDRMPALATTISVEDRWAVVHFIRSSTEDPKPQE